MSILAVYREPFGIEPRVSYQPEGLSLADMAGRMRGMPEDFAARGVICLNGHPVPRALWHCVKPKPAREGVRIEVTFHAPVQGGGDDGKNPLALIAAIGLTIATGFIAGGGFATAGGLFKAGSLSANLLAAGVSLAGSLLLNALSPPPVLDEPTRSRDDRRAASARGNVLEPNGPVPRVVGERKLYPPLMTEPLTYFDGPDEIVEAVYGLAGPHRLLDIRAGGAPIGDLPGVDLETREGWPGDRRLNLIRRYGRTEALQTELRGHLVSDNDGAELDTQTGDLQTSLPQPFVAVTRDAPDEHQLQLIWPQGLSRQASDSDRIRVPFRLRIRPVGDGPWSWLPELHWQAANLRQMRATIRLLWRDDATASPGASTNEGWVEARWRSPGQTAAPAQPDWEADAYFDEGTGDDYLNNNTLGSTRLKHIIMDRYTCAVYLDRAEFPPGRYEVEIRRGCAIRTTTYSSSAYTVGDNVRDLFGYFGTPAQIPQSRDGMADSVVLQRSVSIWNQAPVQSDRFALIAVRARNVALDRVSARAGGYVRDWDGAAWSDWTVTDNPAPHLRDVYAGWLNMDPVPVDIIDEDALVEWRADCVAQGYKVNALIEGGSVMEAAQIIAANGYGKPYMSEVWGVVRDYDRSNEAPVQVFTPRNSANFGWRKAFPRLPDGFRVNFSDASRDYEQRQITVFRPGISRDTGLLEQVTYEGPVTEAEVIQRAKYDLATLESRGTFYTIDTAPESIIARRGSLVGLEHDSLSAQTGAGRVIDVEFDGPDVAAITLDSTVPLHNEPFVEDVAVFEDVPAVELLGAKPGVAIRRRTGAVTVHPLANATGEADRLEFEAPVSAEGLGEGVLVTAGIRDREFKRLIVFAVEPRDQLEASLTLVDEASELFAA